MQGVEVAERKGAVAVVEEAMLCDDDDGIRINRIGRLKRGAAPGGDRPLPGGAQCGSGGG